MKGIRNIYSLIEKYKAEKKENLSGEVPSKPEEWDDIYIYLKALTNLYGVISIEKFIKIYNEHNEH